MAWSAAFVVAGALVVCGVLWLDRPIALFFDRTLRPLELWTVLSRIAHLFELLVALALAGFLIAGLRGMGGRRQITSTWVRVTLAVMLAIACEAILKVAFGRAAPDPTYLRRGIYAFHLLHGRTQWDSFPSGTTAVAFALAGALWQARSRARYAAAAAATLLAVLVVALNWHWFSDAVAGAFLGTWVGVSTLMLLGND